MRNGWRWPSPGALSYAYELLTARFCGGIVSGGKRIGEDSLHIYVHFPAIVLWNSPLILRQEKAALTLRDIKHGVNGVRK